MEWKVPSHCIPSTTPPISAPMRSFISRAALLVKVTANICPGQARRVANMCASRVVSTRVLPVPAPAKHQHRPVHRQYRLALFVVETGKIGRLAHGRGRFGVGEGRIKRLAIAVGLVRHDWINLAAAGAICRLFVLGSQAFFFRDRTGFAYSMIDKRVATIAEALHGIKDGAVVLVGGFGIVGQPRALIEGLIEQGAKDLTIVTNNAGGGGETGLPRLIALGRVTKLICSYPRPTTPTFDERYKSGKLELELVPQGTIAERIRAAGAGIPAFYTATGVGTRLGEGKETREFYGRTYLMERALHADVALIEAWRADRWGNLDLSRLGAELQSGDGDGGGTDHRPEPAHRGTGRARSRNDRDARHLRQPRRACALRRSAERMRARAMNADRTGSNPSTAHRWPRVWPATSPTAGTVNLGVGLPTKVADHIPPDREMVLHSENGILGMGPTPPEDKIDTWIINASKQHVTLRPGAALIHHADSFAIIRGGHIDLCVLGAYEVAENGDIANWATLSKDIIPGVGGAMDLAAGAKRLWVLMEHTTKDGKSRIVERCSYPLTAAGAVKRVYTDLAILDVGPKGFEVVEMAPGVSFDALQARTDARLRMAEAR